MLGTARGVSLRLGKINLAALDSGLQSRDGYLKARRRREKSRRKITTKKYIHIETLWVACRAIVFGGIIITFGILMTILGYFDVYLSQEIVYSRDDGTDKVFTNWTKRYLLKSLQYLGPVLMGIGSFVLIVACVITLESRDKNTQILHNVEEVGRCKKRSLLQKDMAQKRLPMTNEEIRKWTPLYKAVPLSRYDSSLTMNKQRKYRSTPCIPQMLLDAIDNRKLCGRYFDNYCCGIFDTENDLVLDRQDHGRACTSTSSHTSHWQNVTVELHSPPSMPVSNTVKSQPRSSDNEHNSSNIVVTINPSATTAITDITHSATDIRPLTRDSCIIVEGFERHAPLASLDIEFGISSSSSSSNVKVPNIDSFFTT
ncbi:unnamed protein product [Acanthocheilonema viteae]|uniref:Uncharacterized protein n=1 Tax=Acanthocheilonema viteae TaxID=6277 RepID=A0A498S2D1_ACAVI|nr:unnamed protein product [Acanthocheilonema viteae]